GLRRQRMIDALDLVHDAARLDHGNPLLGVALALAHTRLERLLGHRLVGEDADPQLAAALQVAGDGDTGGLDLPRRDPRRLGRLQGVVAEGDVVAALGVALAAAPMVLAVFDLFRHQHGGVPRAEPDGARCAPYAARRLFSLSRSPL